MPPKGNFGTKKHKPQPKNANAKKVAGVAGSRSNKQKPLRPKAPMRKGLADRAPAPKPALSVPPPPAASARAVEVSDVDDDWSSASSSDSEDVAPRRVPSVIPPVAVPAGCHRLFVGGLTHDAQPDLVSARFLHFGKVWALRLSPTD